MENLFEIRPSWRSFFSLSSIIDKFRRPVLSTLGSLQVLNISNCNLSRANLNNLESLSSLVKLDMSGNDFTSIDANLNRLSRLTCLRVIGCMNLKVLPKLPSSVVNLDAQGCVSLVELPKLSVEYNSGRAVFDFKNCLKVVENKTIESLLMMLLPQGRIDIFEEVHIFLPGSRIPQWFSNISMGDYIQVDLPPNWSYETIKGLATCAVITPINPATRSTYTENFCTVKDFNGAVISSVSLLATDDPNSESDQIWLCYRNCDSRWKKAKNHVTVSFKCAGVNCKVKQCGARLVCMDDEPNFISAATQDEPPRKKFRFL
ncbi:TMV resistance protein N-like protein [Tanacetum coccineum]